MLGLPAHSFQDAQHRRDIDILMAKYQRTTPRLIWYKCQVHPIYYSMSHETYVYIDWTSILSRDK